MEIIAIITSYHKNKFYIVTYFGNNVTSISTIRRFLDGYVFNEYDAEKIILNKLDIYNCFNIYKLYCY